jgi:hypothetical protein
LTQIRLKEWRPVWLKIYCRGIEISTLGRVVRKSGPKERYAGYGIMFQGMTKEAKIKTRRLIWTLERLKVEERGDMIPASEIPEDFYARQYNLLTQTGFSIMSSLRHAFHLN